LRRSEPKPRHPGLIVIEHKIIEVRRRWLDTTSDSEAAMCERFVNQLLERWLKIHDQEKTERMT
jgi:hypothetical protein